jgi:hypothetical protein
MNYYLKTTDEAALWTALEAAGLAVKDYDPEDELNQRPDDLDEWQPLTGVSQVRRWTSLVSSTNRLALC